MRRGSAEPGAPPTAGESTESRFLSSTVAAYAGQGARQIVGFASRLILAHLILPGSYGLYELALRAVVFAAAVRDLGLPYQLMRDERRPYGTVFAFSILSGLGITLLLFVGAPLSSVVNEDLPALLRVFAVWVFLDGLIAVPRAYFERELRIGRLLLPELGRALASAAVSIGLAAAGWGVWSLIWGEIIATTVFAALVWWRAWGRVPLRPDWSLIPDLLVRSRFLFLIWILVQLVTYVDIYVVEAFEETDQVGFYGRAYWLAFLMPQMVAALPRALLPALVELRHDLARFTQAFRMGTIFLMTFHVIAGYFLFFNAERVVLFLGPQWLPAVPILQILCFAPFLDVFTDLGGEALKVREEDRIWMLIMAINLISLLGFGIYFTSLWGAQGMAWANLLLLGNLLMAWRMSRIFQQGFRGLLQDLLQVYLLPLPLFLAVAWLFPEGSWERFGAGVVAAGVALLILMARFQRPFRAFFLLKKSS